MSESSGRQSKIPGDPGFAPEDYTDNRELGEWRSKYDREALGCIHSDAAYLCILLALAVTAMFLVWLGRPQAYLRLTEADSLVFARYSFAGLAGMIGGVLFGMKWLYHVVAKQTWNLDRRLWRWFTPFISSGLAFFTVLIVESFGIFDPSLVSTRARAAGFGFLIGLFSDNAMAKLAEVAETLFGPTHRKPPSSADKS